MSGFASIVMLRGRLSRVLYGLIAVPILLQRLSGNLINSYAPLFFAKAFHATLVNVGMYMMVLYLVVALLQIVLVVVSFNRLHDIGLTGFLSVPYLFPLVVGMSTTVGILSGQTANPFIEQVLPWVSRGIYWYGWGLALVLLVLPGRKPRQDVSPAAAF